MLNHEEKYFSKLVNALNININDTDTIKANDPIKKKNKQFSLITTKIGLFIISKPKIRRKTKIKYFVSYFDIEGLDFPSKNTISIQYKNAAYYNTNSENSLIMEMSNESALQTFVITLVDLYLRFSSDSPNFRLLNFTNPPFNISQQPKLINDENNTVLRYYSACAKYQQPFDINTRDLFEEYHIPNDLYVMQFNNRYQMPIHYKTIALPLVHTTNLRVLKFDGFAPKNICKIIYYILKHNHRITTIIMKNYHNLDFAFLNFANLQNPSVVSWTFSNCNFDEPSQQWQFINQFHNYKGNIQKFSIDGFKFPILYAERIAEVICTAYCFRTLEVLEITRPGISQSNSSEVNTVFSYFRNIVPNLKVLQKFTLTHFEIRPSISQHNSKLTRIIETSNLRHLQMSNIDFRKVINSIQFPSTINIIELTRCFFNSTSLINLLKGSSEVRPPLVLNLSGMQIEQTELNIYYKNSHEIPQLSNLIELNYSKNYIAASFIPEFCRIFLPSGIKFLSINNCFGPQQLTPVLRIFNHLSSNTNINGIELRGGKKDTTFGPVMRALLPGLQKVQSLTYIDISCQNWYSSLKNDIYSFISSMKELNSFMAEGAGFPNLAALSSYYNYLLDSTPLLSIGNPFKDVDQMPKNEENQKIYTDQSFQRLRMKLRTKIFLSNRYVRSCYYLRFTDTTKYGEFLQKFPITLINLVDNTYLNEFVAFNHQQFAVRTLLDLDLNEVGNEGLSNFQIKFIESPIEEVEVKTQDLTQFQFPETLRSYMGQYDSKYATNLTRPTIQNKVNAKEVMAKYRGWICKKNQRLFRNLSIASNLFDKVYEEELRGMILSMSKMNEEFGKNIPILEPPTYVSSEAIKVISMQLDTFGVNEGSDSEENTYHDPHNGSGGSHSESNFSNYSSSQLFSTYDERKNNFSRTNSSDYSSFTSDGDENSYSRSTNHIFNTYNPSYKYNNNDSSPNVPLMSPLASSFETNQPSSLPSQNPSGRGKSRRTRKMVNSSAVASDILYMNHGYGLNAFDSEYYEIYNENDDEDHKGIKRRRNNKGGTDFTTLDVLQYAVSSSQELTVSPKQLDALKRIRDSATFLASFRPIRQIPVRRMPEKAIKVDTRLPELFDTLIGTSRQLCKTINQQDVQSPTKQQPQQQQQQKTRIINESSSDITLNKNNNNSGLGLRKKRSKTASLMPYMIEDIVLDSNKPYNDEYDIDSAVISTRSTSLRSLQSKANQSMKSHNRTGAVSSSPPNEMMIVLTQPPLNTWQPQQMKHATIDRQAAQNNNNNNSNNNNNNNNSSSSSGGPMTFSAPSAISPLNISQNPFSQIGQQKNSAADKNDQRSKRSGTYAYSPPAPISPLNIMQNPLNQPSPIQPQPIIQQQQQQSQQGALQQHLAQQPPILQQQNQQSSIQQQLQQHQAQQQSILQQQTQQQSSLQQQLQQHQAQQQSLIQQQNQQSSLQQQLQQHQAQQQSLIQQQTQQSSLQQQLQQHQAQQQSLQQQLQQKQQQQQTQQQSLQHQLQQQQIQQHQLQQRQLQQQQIQQQQSLQQQLQQQQAQQQSILQQQQRLQQQPQNNIQRMQAYQNPDLQRNNSTQKPQGNAPFSAPTDSPLMKPQAPFAQPSILQPQQVQQQQIQNQQQQQQRLQQHQQMNHAQQPQQSIRGTLPVANPAQQAGNPSSLPSSGAKVPINQTQQQQMMMQQQMQRQQQIQQQQQYMQRQQQQQLYMQRQQQQQQMNNRVPQAANQRPLQPPNVQMQQQPQQQQHPLRGTLPAGSSIQINSASVTNTPGAQVNPQLQSIQAQQQYIQRQQQQQQYMQRQQQQLQQQQRQNQQAPPKQ